MRRTLDTLGFVGGRRPRLPLYPRGARGRTPRTEHRGRQTSPSALKNRFFYRVAAGLVSAGYKWLPSGRRKAAPYAGLGNALIRGRQTPSSAPVSTALSMAWTWRTRAYTTHKGAGTWITIGCCLLLMLPALASAFELEPTPIQSHFAGSVRHPGFSPPTVSTPVSLAQSDRDDWGMKKQDTNRKSVSKAALYSALLPGLGERYVGSRKKARYFFAVEALSWLGYLSYHTYGNWKKDDYINFARERAGAQLEDKDDLFHDWVGFYDDIDQFNEFGRVQDRDRPYLVDNESNHWRWRSRSDKSAYREIKNSSREAFRRRDFTVGLMILNRIVSIIDAVHDARKTRRLFGETTPSADGERFGYRLDIDPLSANQQVRLELLARF